MWGSGLRVLGRIAVAKLICTFRSRLSPLLTTATCNVALGQQHGIAGGLWNLQDDSAGWVKLTHPRGIRVPYALQLTVNKTWVEPCAPGSAGQLQTAIVRGYCCRVCGCFRQWFVSSGTEPAATNQVCDRSLLWSGLAAWSGQPPHLGRCLERPWFVFYHVFPKIICWPRSRMKNCLCIHSVSFFPCSLTTTSAHCSWGSLWHLFLFPKSEAGPGKFTDISSCLVDWDLRALLPPFLSSRRSCMGML